MATDYDAPRKNDEEMSEDSLEELTVRVLPRQSDEFTCASCFLVKSQSQLAETKGDLKYCVDCV